MDAFPPACPLSLAGPRPTGYPSGRMKPLPLCLTVLLLASTHTVLARGGEGFHEEDLGGEGFREDTPRLDESFGDGDLDRTGDDSFRAEDASVPADVHIRPEGDDTANVNVRTTDGRDYDANVTGPDGYRSGYIWRGGEYVPVSYEPWAPYTAPFGLWAGWNIVTQPDYVQYPAYASYPVETAVEVALQKLGLYAGPIDGSATSVTEAIEQYQMQQGLPVTGMITPELLSSLGIQATFE